MFVRLGEYIDGQVQSSLRDFDRFSSNLVVTCDHVTIVT